MNARATVVEATTTSRLRRLARAHFSAFFAVIAGAGCAAGHGTVIVDRATIGIDAPASVRLTSRSAATEGAQLLGEVNVVGARSLDVALAAFAREVADRGGNLGVIDAVSTGFEVDQAEWTEPYDCSDGNHVPRRTCAQSHMSMQETAPVVVRGHAYRSAEVTP